MKRKYIYLPISLTLLASTACSDFLESENKAGKDAYEYCATPEGLEALRVDTYNKLKPLVNNTDLTEWGTDLYIATRSSDPGDFHRYKFTPETGGVESYYTQAYDMINNANCLLKFATDNPRYRAEAIFIRSLGYYFLSQQYGAVPYVTTYIESAEKDYPRTPLEVLYNNIINDLEEIINEPSLPDINHGGYISKTAVKALLSKVCLAAGWDLETTLADAAKGTYTVIGSSYFSKAAKYADEIVAANPLTMSFNDKWAPENDGNAEEIFSVQYTRSGFPGDELTGGHGRQGTYGSNYGDPTITGLKSSSGVLAPSPKTLYLWEKEDERYEGTFMTTIYNYAGVWPTTGYYAYYTASEEAKASMVIADKYFPWWVTKAEAEAYIEKHRNQFIQGECPNKCHVHILSNPAVIYSFDANGKQTSPTQQNYYEYVKVNNAATTCVRKFDDPTTPQVTSSASAGYRNIVVFHVSDMYLTAAEAHFMMGEEAKALNLINDVRRRAKASVLTSFADYIPDYEVGIAYEATPIDLILDERARELFAETTRWVDLRRTRQLVKYNIEFNSYINDIADMSNARGEVKWYRPIPATELATNVSISEENQNPGY